MDDLVDGRITNGRGSIDLKSGLRWGGFTAKTPLQNAMEFWTFDFENGIEPDVIDAVAYGYTKEESGGELIILMGLFFARIKFRDFCKFCSNSRN